MSGEGGRNEAPPLDPAEADALLAPFFDAGPLAIAVSGGADSTALMILAADFAKRHPHYPQPLVLTVDHGLRAEAAGECAEVCAMATRFGLPSETLRWHPGVLHGDIQAKAREARYRLLAEAARSKGIAHVLLAHHLDDRAETFLMRLGRGSGLRGLAAMGPSRDVDGVTFLRPLLSVPRRRLEASLRAAGLSWIDDPSNSDGRFLRVRTRQLMPELASIGLTPERLAETAERLSRAASVIERLVGRLRSEAVCWHPGYVRLDGARLCEADEEIALRLLSDLIRDLRGTDYGPSFQPLEAWYGLLRAGEAPRAATLGGVMLAPRRDGLWLYPEAGRTGFEERAVDEDGIYLWDGRLRVVLKGLENRAFRLAALGGAGRRQLEESGIRLPGPAAARESIPGLFDADAGLVAAPGQPGRDHGIELRLAQTGEH
ncbi:tRNA(Ile)-lysidine synthase [Hartmannibacter diazotrophicus]|uniref:tRNA(Ile)-lysidine synthase n=1 Tax=Hartmannibacter diazotrophicus TaxID=1482074 RepID=A0A2C9DAD6_9HYPH|nr:tRNA lysidine(34) synthetase TilS [Hartmannibacter diazotrophicus]SON57139.1 tRNA(Ile)-lysidine synthase [Hartmannibacter diazotrophicus]